MARFRYHEDTSDDLSLDESGGTITIWQQQQQQMRGVDDRLARGAAAVNHSASSVVSSHNEQEGTVQHYYYIINNNDHDDFRHGKSTWKCSHWRFWALALIGILLAIWLECPPAPPGAGGEGIFVNEEGRHDQEKFITTTTTWGSYLAQHARQFLSSSNALVFSTIWHCCKWWFIRMNDAIQAAWSSQTRKVIECPFRQSFDSTVLESVFKQHLVGQDTAIRVLSQTLHEWNYTSHPRLRILLAGFPNTGKRTMAHLLLSDQSILVPESCSKNANASGSSSIRGESGRVLVLHGKDWTIPAWRREEQFVLDSYKDTLSRVIQDFQQKHPSGAVVILEGMDKMDPALLNHVLIRRETLHLKATITAPTSSPLVLVAITSKFGLGAISKAIRHQSYSDFVANIHLELDHAHYDTDWDAIVPFQPLASANIQRILELNINKRFNNYALSRRQFTVRDSALYSLAHSAFYLDWTMDDGRVLSFATAGAQPFGRNGHVWKRLQEALAKTCGLATPLEPQQDDSSTDDKSEYVLDASANDFVVHECPPEGSTTNCKAICKFKLDE